MKLFRFGSLLVAVGLGLFTGPGLADVTATSLFETIPAGTDGSCDGKDIDTMVQEAITLNNKAIQAIDTLLNPKLFWNGGEDERIAKIANAIWGVHLDHPLFYLGLRFRIDDDGRNMLNTVKEHYNLVNKKLNSNSRSDGGKLTCGGNDWLYAATMKDLGYEGTTDSVDAYVSKYFSTKDDKNRYIIEAGKIILTPQFRNGQSLAGKSLCDPPGKAQTWEQSHLVMICDQCFEQDTLSNLWAAQGSWEKGKSIDEVQTAGAEFQHEMFHYIGQEIGDQKIDGVAAYGWLNCLELATQWANTPEMWHILNADGYRVFAMAVFFDLVDWDAEGKKS